MTASHASSHAGAPRPATVSRAHVNLVGDAHDGSCGLMLVAHCSLDPYAELIDPRAELIDPYAELIDPYAELIDPYAELIDPYAELIDPRAGAERIPLELGPCTLVLWPLHLDVAAGAALAARRRHECEQAAHRMGAESLRDAYLQDLHMLPDLLARRARHVITENGRALEGADALRRGDVERLTRLMNASQASLAERYESCSAEAQAAARRLEQAGALAVRAVSWRLGGGVVGLMAQGTAAPAGAAVILSAPVPR